MKIQNRSKNFRERDIDEKNMDNMLKEFGFNGFDQQNSSLSSLKNNSKIRKGSETKF